MKEKFQSSETNCSSTEIEAPKGVLVVGDWNVDEHWVVDDHRSPSGSRTGKRHSRALHLPECSVRSLCGAGQVATILHQSHLTGSDQILLYGLGIWHPDDTDELMQMLDPNTNVGKVPYRLNIGSTVKDNTTLSRTKLFNIADDNWEFDVSTTRIIRVYRPTSGKIELIHRIDWEIPIPPEARCNIFSIENNILAKLRTDIEVSDIVVKDLRKGVICKELVKLLASTFPEANWYVSSKAWKPLWIDYLPARKVKLFLVPQLAAQAATKEDSFSSFYWIIPQGQTSSDALKLMEEMVERFQHALVVVLPDGMSVLARPPLAENKTIQGFMQPNSGDSTLLSLVPMASVFFPTLVARLINYGSRTSSDGKDYFGDLRQSLAFTNHWMELEKHRLIYNQWKPDEDQQFDVTKQYKDSFPWRIFDWESEKINWREAYSDRGVISPRNNRPKEFHLWRAMIDVNGYVTCVDSKRKILQELLSQGQLFRHRTKRQHTSFMLLDLPGSGKSFLVSRLAKALGMRYLPFNVTQMVSRSDLLHCFDTIVTIQAQDPEQPILVFFDEINARLDGYHVYDFFLAPMEDGIYVRSGNSFYIGPCYWIFAGTRLPSGDQEEKGTDFESRLTLPPFDLKPKLSEQREAELARLEKVYLGVASLRAAFPDVRLVSDYVLEVFRTLPRDVTPREISKFVKSFEYIRLATVTSENLPKAWEKTYQIPKRSISELEELLEKSIDDLVAIYGDV